MKASSYTVGAYEAKTHLARLLEEVAAGTVVTITKHGRPVAKLVPADAPLPEPESVIRELRAFRQGKTLGGSLRDLIEEGRP